MERPASQANRRKMEDKGEQHRDPGNGQSLHNREIERVPVGRGPNSLVVIGEWKENQRVKNRRSISKKRRPCKRPAHPLPSKRAERPRI